MKKEENDHKFIIGIVLIIFSVICWISAFIITLEYQHGTLYDESGNNIKFPAELLIKIIIPIILVTIITFITGIKLIEEEFSKLK